MELISDYMRDEKSRHLLNELTGKVFGFSFENWVTEGFFEGDYIPYSFVDNGKMVSNVSANRMKFMQNGTEKYYIQIGTVMTDPEYRNRGLAAKLMKHVIAEYERSCDGIYLFGDLGALDFYRKLGFEVINQHRYFVKDEFCRSEKGRNAFTPVKDADDGLKARYLELVRTGTRFSAFEQLNRFGLQMFYTAGFGNVYYCDELDCFAVLEQDETVVLQSVICSTKLPLTEVLQRLGLEGRRCILGFTPLAEDLPLCVSEEYDGGEDYRLFYRGEGLKVIEREKLYFPELSHA